MDKLGEKIQSLLAYAEKNQTDLKTVRKSLIKMTVISLCLDRTPSRTQYTLIATLSESPKRKIQKPKERATTSKNVQSSSTSSNITKLTTQKGYTAEDQTEKITGKPSPSTK